MEIPSVVFRVQSCITQVANLRVTNDIRRCREGSPLDAIFIVKVGAAVAECVQQFMLIKELLTAPMLGIS